MAAIVAQFFEVCRQARSEVWGTERRTRPEAPNVKRALFVLEEEISEVRNGRVTPRKRAQLLVPKGFYLRLMVTFLITGIVVGLSPRTSTLAILWIVSTGPHSPKIV